MEFLCINLHKLPYVAFLFIIPVPLERLWFLELVWPLVELVWPLVKLVWPLVELVWPLVFFSASLDSDEEEGEGCLSSPYPYSVTCFSS